jgi:hypothetical protein
MSSPYVIENEHPLVISGPGLDLKPIREGYVHQLRVQTGNHALYLVVCVCSDPLIEEGPEEAAGSVLHGPWEASSERPVIVRRPWLHGLRRRLSDLLSVLEDGDRKGAAHIIRTISGELDGVLPPPAGGQET